MTGPSSAPRGEHTPAPGSTWQTEVRVEHLVDDEMPDPRPNRATPPRHEARHTEEPMTDQTTAELVAEAEGYKADYLKACTTIAKMHAAATGYSDRGPERGVVEDVADVRARMLAAEDTVTRVITLHEQWLKAGPPPLGASLARWWDKRLAELHNAIVPPAEQDTPVDRQAVAERRERELKTVGEAQHAAEQERDCAYRERAHLVALLAAMTESAVIAPAPDVEDPGWQIAYLTLGGHQATWHISPRDADLVAHIEPVEPDDPRAQWDGHSTELKYARIAAHTAELAERCGPACAEGHTYTGRCEGAHQADDSDTPTPDVVPPATEPQASSPQQVDEPCPQHPHAPTFDGVCGGCTQYPDDMAQAIPASEEQRDAQQ